MRKIGLTHVGKTSPLTSKARYAACYLGIGGVFSLRWLVASVQNGSLFANVLCTRMLPFSLSLTKFWPCVWCHKRKMGQLAEIFHSSCRSFEHTCKKVFCLLLNLILTGAAKKKTKQKNTVHFTSYVACVCARAEYISEMLNLWCLLCDVPWGSRTLVDWHGRLASICWLVWRGRGSTSPFSTGGHVLYCSECHVLQTSFPKPSYEECRTHSVSALLLVFSL